MEDIITQTKTILFEKIVQSMVDGKSQKDACALHGMNVRTFQREIQSFPNIVNMVIDMNRKSIRERYQRVMDKRFEAIDAILEEAESISEMPLKKILPLERRLHDLQVEFEGRPEIKDASLINQDALAAAAATYLSSLPSLKRASETIEAVIIPEIIPDKPE